MRECTIATIARRKKCDGGGEMKKSDISNISNAESVERAEDSGQMNAQPSGQVSERFSKKANRLFGADPVGLD